VSVADDVGLSPSSEIVARNFAQDLHLIGLRAPAIGTGRRMGRIIRPTNRNVASKESPGQEVERT
jgi:hypothetical protein